MNYYDILEVSPNASPEVIRAAYKSLMQRYHPDRHPDNAATAARATQIAQAYKVLADATMRADYDRTLKRPAPPRNKPLVAKHREFHSMMWAGGMCLILIGGYFLLPSSKPPAPEVELKTLRATLNDPSLTRTQIQSKINRIDAILNAHPAIKQQEARVQARALAARTLPNFITNATVKLSVPALAPDATGKLPSPTDVTLLIPSIAVQIGSFDADQFKQHIEKNQAFISQKLAEKLVQLQYDQLTKPNAERYLKKAILDALNDITQTNPHENYPSTDRASPSRYGVIAVSLPESFSMR